MKTKNIFLALLVLSSALETSALAASNFQVQVRMGSGPGSVPLVNAEVAVFDQNDIIPRITDGSGIASFGAFPDGDFMFSIRKDGQVLLSLSSFVIDAPGVYMINLLDGRHELYSPRPGTGSTSGGSSSGGSTSGGSSSGSISGSTAGSGGASTPPPPPAACGSHPSGSTWSEPTTVQRAPVACPAEHTGTRTGVFQNYQPKLCTNGVVSNNGTATQTLTGYENSTCLNRAITGYVDGVVRLQGDYFVRGWACAANTPQSIDVYLFSGGPAGAGLPIGQFKANIAGEPQINGVCGDSGIAHRYQIPINQYLLQHQGRSIWVQGLTPHAGFSNNVLSASGAYLFPASPPQPTATTLANVAQGKPVTQNVAGSPAYTYPAANLTDGNTSSYAYPAHTVFDYTVQLRAEYRVQLMRLWWNQWGFNSPHVYVTSWQVQAGDDYGTWTTIASGGVPQAAFSEFTLDRRMRAIRVIATSTTNWFGVYELQAYGDLIPSPVGSASSPLVDFTGDRLADYADLHLASGQFWVHANLGNGSFNSAAAAFGTATPSASAVWKTLAGDFNGDRLADYADYHVPSGQIWVHLNNGAGGFNATAWPVNYVNYGAPVEILTCDFNGDGKTDIMERDVRYGSFNLRVNSSGTFVQTGVPIAFKAQVGSNWTVVAGDFNGDGLCDVADYFIPNGTFWAHVNTGGGNGFAEGTYAYNSVAIPAGPDWKRVYGDFNGDGRADFADLHKPSGQFWVHRNLGTSFDPNSSAFADTARDASTWRLLGE